MKRFSIGEMAELNCISTKTLRLYHELDLLEPAHIDEESGYRFYDISQCSTIDMIQQLQHIGISLADIKSLMECNDSSRFSQLVHDRRRAIQNEIDRLSLSKYNAARLIEHLNAVASKPLIDVVVLERFSETHVLTFPILNKGASVLYDDAESFLEEWELNLRMTKRYMLDQDLPPELFHNIGCRISRSNLKKRWFKLSGSFITIHGKHVAEQYGAETIPAGYYLTITKSSYTDSNKHNTEIEGLNTLLDYADANNLEIVGDYFGEIIADTPAFDYTGRDMLYKLEVPVQNLETSH